MDITISIPDDELAAMQLDLADYNADSFNQKQQLTIEQWVSQAVSHGISRPVLVRRGIDKQALVIKAIQALPPEKLTDEVVASVTKALEPATRADEIVGELPVSPVEEKGLDVQPPAKL